MPKELVNEEIDYTRKGRNKIEIDKLHVEVAEMRSRFRRWIGSLGGLLGIATAAVSVIVTSQQWDRASRETNLAKTQLATERAKFDADRANVDRANAEKIELQTKERITAMMKEVDIAEGHKTAAEAAAANSLAVEAQARADRDAVAKELSDRKGELETVQTKLAALAKSLKDQPGASEGAAAATALATSTRNLISKEHSRLVEDSSRARLFFFVLDSQQRENAWKLEASLRGAGFYIGNVIVFGGKRDETPALRYFRDVDQQEAEKLRDTLASLGLEKTHLSRVNDPDSAGTGRKFQIWVRKEDFR